MPIDWEDKARKAEAKLKELTEKYAIALGIECGEQKIKLIEMGVDPSDL